MKYEFHEEGTWFVAMLPSGSVLFFKTTEEEMSGMKDNVFKAWHVSRPINNGLTHMASSIGTVDPWFLNSTHFLSLMPVDPEGNANLDAMYKEKFSTIKTATSIDAPPFEELRKRFGKEQ